MYFLHLVSYQILSVAHIISVFAREGFMGIWEKFEKKTCSGGFRSEKEQTLSTHP